MSAAYLEKLNPDQRRAVEHGICEPAAEAAPALLVIAGAGSGKTSTLAHRVVHLAANGVQTAINYPTALPFLAAYSRFKHRPEQFPNAFGDQSHILSLPMFAEITRDQQVEVIDLIRAF